MASSSASASHTASCSAGLVGFSHSAEPYVKRNLLGDIPFDVLKKGQLHFRECAAKIANSARISNITGVTQRAIEEIYYCSAHETAKEGMFAYSAGRKLYSIEDGELRLNGSAKSTPGAKMAKLIGMAKVIHRDKYGLVSISKMRLDPCNNKKCGYKGRTIIQKVHASPPGGNDSKLKSQLFDAVSQMSKSHRDHAEKKGITCNNIASNQ